MNIIEAAETLNIRHDADNAVIRAAYHALGKKHHPDHGGNTARMQRINAAHDYMSTRTQAARRAEWERLQKPAGYSGSPNELHGYNEERSARRKTEEAKAQASPPRYTTTRTWTPPKPSPIQRYQAWKGRQTRPARWAMALIQALLIIAGRVGWLAAIWYACYRLLLWTMGVVDATFGVLAIFINIFVGAMVVMGLGTALLFFSLNFLTGGWKGLNDYLNDRHPDPLSVTKYAKDRTI